LKAIWVSGTVPVDRLPAFRLVRPAPLPLKLPALTAPLKGELLALSRGTNDERTLSGRVPLPVNKLAGTLALAVNAPNKLAALRLVRPEPLPVKLVAVIDPLSVRLPPLSFGTLAESTESGRLAVPVSWLAPSVTPCGSAPVKLPAGTVTVAGSDIVANLEPVIEPSMIPPVPTDSGATEPAWRANSEYGVGDSCWRPPRTTKLSDVPLVRTLICNQRSGPVKKFVPKSTTVVNNPLVMKTPALVAPEFSGVWALTPSKSWKLRSKKPLAGTPLAVKRP